MKSIFIVLGHLLIVGFLTIVTQIGGFIWIMALVFLKIMKIRRTILVPTFLSLYIIISLLIIPFLARIGGRVPLPISSEGILVPHNYITVLLNRHYVKERLLVELEIISKSFGQKHPQSQVKYLDANFPFFDGFPLLPHRSHDDGRKIDLSFFYTLDGGSTNSKPSRLGYGYFEEPIAGEVNQAQNCIQRGYWQYDFTKYITLGSSDRYMFDDKKTKTLLEIILSRSKTHKVFIEPHLKTRLNIKNDKCRFHGCKAVRHDDHIHYQVI